MTEAGGLRRGARLGGREHGVPVVRHDASKFVHLVGIIGVLVVVEADHSEELPLGHARVLMKPYAQLPFRKPLHDEVDVAQVWRDIPEGLRKCGGVRRGPPLERDEDEDRGMQDPDADTFAA